MQRACSHGVVGDAIDQDEATQLAAAGVRLKHHRLIELQLDDTDVIELEPLSRQVLQQDAQVVADAHRDSTSNSTERYEGPSAWYGNAT